MPKFVLEDSRIFTDWRSNCQINMDIQKKYGITDSNQYRQFLHDNSDKLINDNNVFTSENPNCPVCNNL